MKSEPLDTTLKRLLIVIIFSVAFGYIEATVVVYLRAIFHPDGFAFPLETFGLSPLWKRLLLIEIGREASTVVIMLTGAWLFGWNLRQRFAYFLMIFAVWDIFYYVWLKALLGWPASIMDWDILFLIPTVWASPVLCPLLVSVAMFVFAVVIFYRDSYSVPIKVTVLDWFGFIIASIIIVVSFCVAGLHVTEPDFQAYFYWPLFALGYITAIAFFLKCFFSSG